MRHGGTLANAVSLSGRAAPRHHQIATSSAMSACHLCYYSVNRQFALWSATSPNCGLHHAVRTDGASKSMSSRQRPTPLRADAITPPPTIGVPAQPTPLIGRDADLAAL